MRQLVTLPDGETIDLDAVVCVGSLESGDKWCSYIVTLAGGMQLDVNAKKFPRDAFIDCWRQNIGEDHGR